MVQCSLRTVDFSSAPAFGALSYVWGDPAVTREVKVEGMSVAVTKNLHDALVRVRSAELAILLWVDALCINQKDYREREQQVGIMARLYKSARRVIVWLGTDEEGEMEGVVELMEILSGLWKSQTGSSQGSASGKPSVEGATDVSPPKSEHWDALARFFGRPWWGRMWVVQEVTATDDPVVLCGSRRIEWEIIGNAAAWIDANRVGSELRRIQEKFDVAGNKVSNAVWMHNGTFLQCDSLLELLTLGRSFAATNPLDKIYALLGFPAAKGLATVPDYEVTKHALYRRVAVHTISESSNLQVLSCCYHAVDLDKQPEPWAFTSWVPQWNTDEFVPRFGFFPWSADGKRAMKLRKYPEYNELQAKGCLIDVVDGVRVMKPRWYESYAIQQWQSHCNRPKAYPAGGDFLMAIMTILSGGLNADQVPVTVDFGSHRDDFSAWLLQCLKERDLVADNAHVRDLAAAARRGDRFRYAFAVKKWCADHTFFSTRKGYAGLGPPIMGIDDKVVVLYGCRVPLILRSMGRDGMMAQLFNPSRRKLVYYRLVGEAYLHGFMAGEVFVEKTVEEQVFLIY